MCDVTVRAHGWGSKRVKRIKKSKEKEKRNVVVQTLITSSLYGFHVNLSLYTVLYNIYISTLIAIARGDPSVSGSAFGLATSKMQKFIERFLKAGNRYRRVTEAVKHPVPISIPSNWPRARQILRIVFFFISLGLG